MRQIEALATSTEQYPVDFDDAWVWVGYSSKGSAKRSLEANFEEGLDYTLYIDVKRVEGNKGGGSVRYESICLTTDCFKQFCMMAGTEQGKEIRKYFIQCEQELKQIKSRPQPQPQTNADPFIQMIEQDLEQVGVATAFIKGWKYDALKALYPERAQVFVTLGLADGEITIFASL